MHWVLWYRLKTLLILRDKRIVSSIPQKQHTIPADVLLKQYRRLIHFCSCSALSPPKLTITKSLTKMWEISILLNAHNSQMRLYNALRVVAHLVLIFNKSRVLIYADRFKRSFVVARATFKYVYVCIYV